MNVLNLGLALAGMPEKTIGELNAQLPALERLAAEAKAAEPIITQLIPHVQKAWPDIVAVLPLLQDLVAFVKQKQAGG